MHQLDMLDAIAAGEAGMAQSLGAATRRDPEFANRAEEAILHHLRVVGQCSGEVLTDIARARGAIAPDDRAFGAVYRRLLRARRIVVVGFTARSKGHGSQGAKLYALGH